MIIYYSKQCNPVTYLWQEATDTYYYSENSHFACFYSVSNNKRRTENSHNILILDTDDDNNQNSNAMNKKETELEEISQALSVPKDRFLCRVFGTHLNNWRYCFEDPL